MDAGFWHQKWARGEIGFHESATNPLLIRHFAALGVHAGDRVFLPLCGKTRDIAWLLNGGYRIVGAELSAIAIGQLFDELGVAPRITQAGELAHYSASGIDVFVGDIFALKKADIGPADAIYDRAALIALPAGVRERYTSHLLDIIGVAPQLLVTLEYDQHLLEGPPFSVDEREISRHYGATYNVQCLERNAIEGGLKGKVAAIEAAWLLGCVSG